MEFLYDKNGNLTTDLDRDIVTIRYNILNLPDTIQFKYGNQIINRYDAGGAKLETTSITPSVQLNIPLMKGQTTTGISKAYINSTLYAGNIEYKAEKAVNTAPWNLSYSLDAIYNPEGVVRKLGTELVHHYYRRDHLGNIREVWQTAYRLPIAKYGLSQYYPASTVQQTQYYPSGLPWAESTGASMQPHKYNGKEFIEAHGLDEYDSEARWYYPTIMRFTTVDPLAEKYYNISPYAWCGNNPVNAIDPDGRMPIFLVPLTKGAVGAVVDAAAQVTVSMANGQSFGQSLSNLDYTSVGASFVTSVIAMPGMSTTAKAITVGVVAFDAAVDISISEGVKTVGGIVGENKSITNASIDAVSSFVPGKVVDNVTSGFNKAVSSDLGSSAAATLTKETKSSLKQVQATVNSTAVQTGANAAAGYAGGVVGGQANKAIGTGSTTRVSVPFKDPTVQPNDKTRVQKPIFPIYP